MFCLEHCLASAGTPKQCAIMLPMVCERRLLRWPHDSHSGMLALVQSLAIEYRLALGTHFEVTEYSKSDRMLLPRFGYKETVFFHLGCLPSLALSIWGASTAEI